jgi:hypothetical protein
MALKRVVPGSLTDAYKKREGDFAPSLVGNQFTDSDAFFTLGNFSITTNFEGSPFKDFTLGDWSDYYSLNNLNITVDELDTMVSNQVFVKLNFNKEDVSRYVYFGSFAKFIESEIQDIILKWPASIFICSTPPQPTLERPSNLNTVLDYSYDLDTDTTTFRSPIIAASNPFNLDVSENLFIPENVLNNVFNYVLTNYDGSEEYVINDITGYTPTNNYIYVSVKGNCFKSLSGSTFGKIDYHIKPIKEIRDKFFNNLTDFQNVLLDRLQTPNYKAVFNVPIKYEDGDIGFSLQTFVWPTSDNYNLDINTFAYENYIEGLFKLAALYDEAKTDLVLRRFVSDSIKEYDTDGDGTDRFGRKVSKLLRVYGAEFDVIKKYIDGLSFANVVTYNKKDNTSDNLIKMMAKTLGFDVLLTLGGFNIVEDNSQGDNPQFKGYSRELSAAEIDIELWRRLVINAWWLFRSKGTRKVLEFFLELFNIDECLASLNERVYIARDKVDMTEILDLLQAEIVTDIGTIGYNIINPTTNLPEFYSVSEFAADDLGFPQTPTDSFTLWFQNDGFWYNGGNERTEGNNPHYGVYDFGQRYWDRYRCFLRDFEPETFVERLEEIPVNYFTEYNNGTFTPGEFGQAFSNYGDQVPEYLIDPNDNIRVLSAGLVEYGDNDGPRNVRDTGDTYSLRITFQAGESTLCNNCPPEASFANDGMIYVSGSNGELLPHNIEECCDFYWLPNNTVTQCPQTILINNSGIVNEVTDRNCCTKTIVGQDVTWVEDTTGGYCILTSYIPVVGGGVTGDNVISQNPTDFLDSSDLFVPQTSTVPYVLDMVNTTVTPTQQVDCTNSIVGLPAIITNPVCLSNNCTDCSYGSITVNQGSTVTVTFQLFGGATAACCKYQAMLFLGNLTYLLNADQYQTAVQTITLNPGTYPIKLCLKEYTCGSGYASISVQTNTVTTTDGVTLPNIDFTGLDFVPHTGPTGDGDTTDVLNPNGGDIPAGNNEGYYCWWCPPIDSMVVACNTEQYLNSLNLTDQTTISLAQTYGYNGNDLVQATNFLNNLYGTYFQTGRCIYMFNGEPLKNKDCCSIRGGVWNPENKICEKLPEQNICPAEQVVELYDVMGIPNNLNETPSVDNFTPLNEVCCEQLNYNYGPTIITLNNLDGTVDNVSPTNLVTTLLTTTQGSSESSCFNCPREYQENTVTINDNTINYYTDLEGGLITEDCCNKLGFNYQTVVNGENVSNLCIKCNNNDIIINGNYVFNTNGQALDKYCCEFSDFYYLNQKCYQCPLLIEGNYLLVNTVVLGVNYTTIVKYDGTKLSNTCCNYYKQQTGNSSINYNNDIGCYFS